MIYFKSRPAKEVQILRIWEEEITLQGKWTMQNSFKAVKGLWLEEARKSAHLYSGRLFARCHRKRPFSSGPESSTDALRISLFECLLIKSYKNDKHLYTNAYLWFH